MARRGSPGSLITCHALCCAAPLHEELCKVHDPNIGARIAVIGQAPQAADADHSDHSKIRRGSRPAFIVPRKIN